MDELRPDERRIIDVWHYGSDEARRMLASIADAEAAHMERRAEERRGEIALVGGDRTCTPEEARAVEDWEAERFLSSQGMAEFARDVVREQLAEWAEDETGEEA